MARKGWGDLSPTYRKRLERGGIGRHEYEAGAALSNVRGHGKTPEHPLPANKSVPKRYQRWNNIRHGTPIKMLTSDGEQWLTDVSALGRSRIASHWNAVKSYLFDIRMPKAFWWNGRTRTALNAFKPLSVTGSPVDDHNHIGLPAKFKFMTDTDDIAYWTQSDVLEFTQIYKSVA
jgi:hypothetical protein